VTTVVRGDTACISALHVLKVYAQRLGCDLRSSRLVSRVMASSFLVVSRHVRVLQLLRSHEAASLTTVSAAVTVPAARCSKSCNTQSASVTQLTVHAYAFITSVVTWRPAGHRCAGGRHLPAVAALARGSGGAHRRPPPPGPAPHPSPQCSSPVQLDRAAQTDRQTSDCSAVETLSLFIIVPISRQFPCGRVRCLDEQSPRAISGSVVQGWRLTGFGAPFNAGLHPHLAHRAGGAYGVRRDEHPRVPGRDRARGPPSCTDVLGCLARRRRATAHLTRR
jgi:hypothetical protein